MNTTLVRRGGVRVPGAWDAFELCVRAILGQQVTVAGARNYGVVLVDGAVDEAATAALRAEMRDEIVAEAIRAF